MAPKKRKPRAFGLRRRVSRGIKATPVQEPPKVKEIKARSRGELGVGESK